MSLWKTLSSKLDEATDATRAANKIEADKLAALKQTENLKPGDKAISDAAAASRKKADEAAAAAKADPKKVEAKNAENTKNATPEEIKKADELAKSEGMVNYCKTNPKTCIALGGTAALALYMIINKKTNPAEAAGEMLGEVGKGAFGGLLDSLGLGFIADYLPYMSVCCSCCICMFIFMFIYKTFLQ